MRSQDFAYTLQGLAELLNLVGAQDAGDQLGKLAEVFGAAPTNAKVSDAVIILKTLQLSQAAGSPSLSDVERIISSLRKLLEKTAKPEVLRDVDAVVDLLRNRPIGLTAFTSSAIGALNAQSQTKDKTPPTRDDLVLEYRQELERDLRDHDKFSAVYNDLISNAEMGNAELVSLARQFTEASVRTRDQALKKIWQRHQDQMGVMRKSKATGGRTAA
ncbi:MAG: hypothetical protein WB760_11645 [Xanthobacteraceae bacterium]